MKGFLGWYHRESLKRRPDHSVECACLPPRGRRAGCVGRGPREMRPKFFQAPSHAGSFWLECDARVSLYTIHAPAQQALDTVDKCSLRNLRKNAWIPGPGFVGLFSFGEAVFLGGDLTARRSAPS